jgi:predicted nucleotidyltransferase
MPHIAIDYDKEKLRDFCRRWRVTEFSLFGSVVRDDFGPESDVDVLVTLRLTRTGPCSTWFTWRTSSSRFSDVKLIC